MALKVASRDICRHPSGHVPSSLRTRSLVPRAMFYHPSRVSMSLIIRRYCGRGTEIGYGRY